MEGAQLARRQVTLLRKVALKKTPVELGVRIALAVDRVRMEVKSSWE